MIVAGGRMSSPSLPPGTRFGSYEILAPIGAGGMGEVYRARDTKLKRDVAVKVLPGHLADDPIALARFEREAQAVAALSHPNILAIFDFGREKSVSYAVMELLEGETLRARLEQGTLPVRKAVDFALQMANGLAAAHEKDIVHRDLKPENVFVTRDGRIKIFDFGLAKLRVDAVEDDAESATIDRQTTPGAVMGTVGYMSPEQVRGHDADHRTDIFSLGAVLHEMLSGRRTFRRDSHVETMNAILTEDPAELGKARDVPPALARIVRRCLEKSPEERFQSARDLAFAIEAISDVKEGVGDRVHGDDKPAERSIAVLPFTNMSADPENEYFSDGISEEIINALTQLEGLRVAARTSSFTFKGKEADIAEVGAKLHVETVLEGSVRKAGNRLRITAQLVNVADGYHLWSDRYDRELDDVFAIQDEIAAAIADRLRVTLAEGKEQRRVKPPTGNLEAYELYLKGRAFWNQRGGGLRPALECFEKALSLDADYALAHVGVAEAYSLIGFYGLARPREVMPKAKAAAERALELDEYLAEAHSVLAFTSFIYDWDWRAANRGFRRAIELKPTNPVAHYWYAMYLSWVEDRADEAVAEARRAVEVDPFGAQSNSMLAMVLYCGQRYEEVILQSRKARECDPSSSLSHRFLGLAYQAKSSYADAVEALQESVILSGRDPWFIMDLGATYALSGKSEEAEALQDELVTRAKQAYVHPSSLFGIPLTLGRIDEAFAYLEKGVDERDPGLVAIKRWPCWKSVHGQSRFEALAKRMRLR
jgi:serine/threonine protein kinase/tetratricopeptide (TPR) repeat protein